ncbi:hypothetical protein IKE72_00175 [Candidatus Saccharibacteria bacterium]|jgi:hypothetical protein|nr:hypothetical protein [Candidatus Saccharibacteria bacterium]
MRVVCVYREHQDYSRTVSDWIEDFYRRTGYKLETIDPDRDPHFCETYSIIEYPTILAISEDGGVRAFWAGRQLPMFNEVLYYIS